jgi:hypothetical protein
MSAPSYRHGRFVVSKYEFQKGGESDVYIIDFVSDSAQGFNVPAKSVAVKNHAGGSGNNLLYFRTTEDGRVWDRPGIIDPDTGEGYDVLDGCVFYGVMLWSSNPNLMFSLRATPGVWTERELSEYIPVPGKPTPLAILTPEQLLAEMSISG